MTNVELLKKLMNHRFHDLIVKIFEYSLFVKNIDLHSQYI